MTETISKAEAVEEIKVQKKKKSVFSLLGPYTSSVILLALLSVGASGLGLVVPKIISHSIDAYIHRAFDIHKFVLEFSATAIGIFAFTYLQNILQTFTAEKVARDLRNTLASKIADQSYEFVERVTPSKLLTNLTSDIDSIKMFVGQAVASLISAVVIIVGAGALLISINWKLALAVLAIIPIIAGLFFFIFSRVRVLMKKSREIIDLLNKVINESVLGSALIRVLNSQQEEFKKFVEANTRAKDVGLQILNMFATLIPIITFVANLAALVILLLGGHFVINGSMSLGDFAAFNSYIGLLIFPIFVMGIMGSVISQSQASFDRISEVLDAEDLAPNGDLKKELEGRIEFKNVEMKYSEKTVLKDASFIIEPKTRTAIIGPTAAGKTQVLHLLTRLMNPTSGEIKIDNEPITTYDAETLHRQIGFVFQDSIIFNLTVRENIAFGGAVSDEALTKAIKTAELEDFIQSLPEGLETIISERGSSLSGGQKQRIMLARALALDPKILLLDDFTARVDTKTEKKIIENLKANYQGLTLVSVTQKIASVESYDKIIVLMEGEVMAEGTHEDLLKTSLEYAQINDSQKSTNTYE
jgi:ATP-binding cassette subfamily B protein